MLSVLPQSEWLKADASFDREDGNRWHGRGNLPKEWNIETVGLKLRLSGTDFGHLGVFPEQHSQWSWIRETVSRRDRMKVLNLFAYSGGSTIAAALGGAEVCHLDASKGMVEWARANAALNSLADHPIRWIVDDAHKFMRREIRRGRRYDCVARQGWPIILVTCGRLGSINHTLLSLEAIFARKIPLAAVVMNWCENLDPVIDHDTEETLKAYLAARTASCPCVPIIRIPALP